MDYLGLQKLPLGQNTGAAQQYRHGRPLQHPSFMSMLQTTAFYGPKATTDFPTEGEINCDRGSKQANTKDGSLSDTTGTENSAKHSRSPSPSPSPSTSPSPSPSRSASVQRTPLDKPLEELTEEDIMQLTREDCRRYLKEKGMRRPSWNKSQAIQQVLSLKGLFDSKGNDEKRLRPSNDPKKLAKESSVTKKPSDVQHKRLVATTQQSLPMVGNERSQELCTTSGRVPEKHGRNDLHTTFQPDACHPACRDASVSSVVGELPTSLPTYTCPTDSSIAVTVQHLEKNNTPSQTTCSQCVQTIGAMGRQPSAQLTIFYSGMVNVYDNVPADKAQAIMLLASGNTLKHLPCLHTQGTMNVPITTLGTTASSLPAPYYVHSPLVTAQALLTTSPSVSASISQGSRAIHSEQQPSREACLQRYLEKRRDRYRVRAPYLTSTKVSGGDSSPQVKGRCSHILVGLGSETSSPHTLLQTSFHSSPVQRSREKQSILTDGERCLSDLE